MIDWKIDNSYGLLGVWYTDTNLYLYLQYKHFDITGRSYLNQIFWEHENLSSLSVIKLSYIKLYKEKDFGKKIWANQESGLTAVQLKGDPPVYTVHAQY